MTQVKPIWILLALAAFLLGSRPALSMIGSVNCEGSETVNIRLGLPTNLENPELYARKLEMVLGEFGRCGDTAQVSVETALGSDYEILHWLTLGLVDAAVVGEVTQYLLRQDGVPVVEIPLEEKESSVLLGRFEYWDPQGGKKAIDWESSALQDTLEWHWCGAVASTVKEKDLKGVLQDGGCKDLPQGPSLMVFPSHLDSAAFAGPVGKTQEWLESRLQLLNGHCVSCVVPLGRRLTESFWNQVLAHSSFTFGTEMPLALASGNRALLRFTSELVLHIGEEGGERPEGQKGPQLVMAREWAERLLGPIVFHRPVSNLPVGFKRLLRQRTQALRAFWPLRKPPDQVFRVRAFQFTLEESIRLIRSHQESSQQSALALVLPGGGVKAAYQTPVVERLYSHRHLINSQATLPFEHDKEPLKVEAVIGTSGGALLGYFVARLDSRLKEDLPWTMVDLLWKKPHKGGRKVLESQGRLRVGGHAPLFQPHGDFF